MPKEEGHFGERAARTSKNAKDKSNSATLRASQGGAHVEQSGMSQISNRMLRCDSEKDSEKDSGYSEAGSDSIHTDVDDQRSSVSEPHIQSSKSLNNNNNNSVKSAGRSMGPYEELTPIYIIKNLVVKPSRPEQLLHGPLVWDGGWHSLNSAKAPTHLLLIQQPAMPAPSPSTLASSSSLATPQGRIKKGGSSGRNSYLPILNSYPRIAPHPRKESHVQAVKESGSEGQSQSKRVCIEEEKRGAVPTSSPLLKLQQQQQQQQQHSQYRGRGGHSHPSSTSQHKFNHWQQSSSSDSVGSPSISSSQIPSTLPPPSSSSPSSSTAQSPSHPTPDSSSTRHQRFLNTAEILNQSGLLAITLCTKELLKQNAAIDEEIAQLHQHTRLLYQVAQANQNGCSAGSDSLEKLLLAMAESGCYPNLNLKHQKALSSSCQQSKTTGERDKEKDNSTRTTETQVGFLHNTDDGTSPPSPLFAPSPDIEEREHSDAPLDPMAISLSVSEQ